MHFAEAILELDGDLLESPNSVHVTKVGVLRIRQVLESKFMSDLADDSILPTVPYHQNKTGQCNQPDVQAVYDDVH